MKTLAYSRLVSTTPCMLTGEIKYNVRVIVYFNFQNKVTISGKTRVTSSPLLLLLK